MVDGVEAAERRVAEAPSGTFMLAAAVVFAAAVGIACRSEYTNRRWWKANHPFAGPKARFESMGTTYRDKRAVLAEVVYVLGGIIAEIARALEHAQPSSDRSGSEEPTM